jgi:DivIVA domain-containing protein
VNGDEVRDTRFLGPAGKFIPGYDAVEVDELLGRIAAERSACQSGNSAMRRARPSCTPPDRITMAAPGEEWDFSNAGTSSTTVPMLRIAGTV